MKLFLVITLLLVLPSAFSETVTLRENQSFSDDGKNVTLLRIDNIRNKALFCVNNKQAIISENNQKTVDEVSLSVKKITKDSIKVGVDVYCKNCECNDNCLNLECSKPIAQEEISEDIIKKETAESSIIIEREETIENESLSAANVTLALVILVVFSIILYYLIKK